MPVRFAIALLATTAVYSAELRISVAAGSGQPIWARLEVHGPDGKMYQPAEGAIRDRTAGARTGKPYYPQSFVIRNQCVLNVPPGSYRLVAEHGPEYERVERTVEVTPHRPSKVDLKIPRWIDMRKKGWYSGDMHVHRPLDDLAALAQAEDLNYTVAFTMWNRRNMWADRPMPAKSIYEAAPGYFISVMNAEDERGGGAWMFHDIPKPLDLASMLTGNIRQTESWYPPGLQFIEQVRAWRKQGSLLPWFDSEKPIWWELPVVMALNPPDSLGLLHNHFNQYGILDNEAWARPRDMSRYPGYKGFADYVLSLNYRYLNLGFRIPWSAGSASGVLPNPVGYNRIYAHLEGEFTPEKWYAAIKANRHFVTNGPMLFFNASVSGNKLKGAIEVHSREPLDTLELIGNGRVIQTFPAHSAKHLNRKFSIGIAAYTWVAARAFVRNGDTVRLAHSTPIVTPGTYDARADARYFVQWIDDLIANTTPKRTAAETDRNQLLNLYRRAREFYLTRTQ
ncbi:MAG: hypothetical protein IT168_16815 [Bryobacterales bacterium]|nr:hypothetical protein [Bryobacterales bacterium]